LGSVSFVSALQDYSLSLSLSTTSATIGGRTNECLAHHNPTLYEAMKSYVASAINLVAIQIASESPSNVDDEPFFFARLAASDDLIKLPEYQTYLAALKGDSVICSQLRQLLSPKSQGRRSILLIGMNWFSPVSKTKFLTRLRVWSDCPDCAI
jgi:hypothetical protein